MKCLRLMFKDVLVKQNRKRILYQSLDYHTISCKQKFGKYHKRNVKKIMLPPKHKWTPIGGSPLFEKEMLISLKPSKQMYITNIVNFEVSNKRVMKVISE